MDDLVPVLSCRQAVAFEKQLLQTEDAVRAAMQSAGQALGEALVRDYCWLRPWPATPRLLVLAGKGNNAGDALIAARTLAGGVSGLSVTVYCVFGREQLRPLAKQALEELLAFAGTACAVVESGGTAMEKLGSFDVTFDGIFGAQFRLPIREPVSSVLSWCRQHPRRLGFRAAVDLPSGLGDDTAATSFVADVTYATGIVKEPVLRPSACAATGRVRFLDLGFFGNAAVPQEGASFAGAEVLCRMLELRPSTSDKRSFGRVYLIGGSSDFPGAILMSAQAAARAGSGLVTAMVADDIAARLSVGAPEVMWRALPTQPGGSFGPGAAEIVMQTVQGGGVLLIGPGLQVDSANSHFVSRLLMECPRPIILDAGALYPEIVDAARERPSHYGAVIVTPHAGEFQRIARCSLSEVDAALLRAFAKDSRTLTVLKGPVTRVCDGANLIYAAGHPVLARGGSGDILGGMMAARLAVASDPLTAATEAVVWHAEAANLLARARGEIAVRTTELLDYLAPALRGPEAR